MFPCLTSVHVVIDTSKPHTCIDQQCVCYTCICTITVYTSKRTNLATTFQYTAGRVHVDTNVHVCTNVHVWGELASHKRSVVAVYMYMHIEGTCT